MRPEIKDRLKAVKERQDDKKATAQKGLEAARKMPANSIPQLRSRVEKLEELFEQYINGRAEIKPPNISER